MAQFNISDELYEALGSENKKQSKAPHNERVTVKSRDLTPFRNGRGSVGNIPRGFRRGGRQSKPIPTFVQGRQKSCDNIGDERSPFGCERNSSESPRKASQDKYFSSGQGKFDKKMELHQKEIPDFMYSNLKALMRRSSNEIVTYLSSKKEGFTSLLALDLRPDMIMLLVEIFAKSHATTLKENHAAVLALSVKPNVLEMLSNHSLNFTAQNMKYSDVDLMNYFENLAIFYQDVVDIIPNTAAEHLQEYVTKAFMGLTTAKFMKNVPVSEALELKYNILTASVKSLIELKKSSAGGKSKNKAKQEWQPGVDFRELSIFPLPNDVLCRSEVQLCPLVKCGAYKSVEHYLDVNFILLREDFLIPLREGISNFICQSSENKKGRPKRIENVRFYRSVRFVDQCIDGESLVYVISFDPNKRLSRVNWRRSKRFLFGSLLCFSNDSFRSLLVGVVKNRDLELLEKGLLMVELIGNSSKVELFQEEFTVAESEIYFEAYQHVLKALQNFNEESFPMKEYVINVCSDRILPNYLATNPNVEYTFKGFTFPVIFLEDWPEVIKCIVNDSQLRAVHSALTKKCAVIQGPPGTGKTYIGLIIAGILLENKAHWRVGGNGPILVVCFTNHALDQFLEGILAYTRSVIRVGNQSRNENLNEYNLKNQRRRGPIFLAAIKNIEQELQSCLNDMTGLHGTVKEYFKKIGIISLEYLSNYMTREHVLWFTDEKGLNNSLLVEWLLSGSYFQEIARIQLQIDDVQPMSMKHVYACSLYEIWDNIHLLQTDMLEAVGNERDYLMWLLTEYKSRFVNLKSRLSVPLGQNQGLIGQLNAVHNLDQLTHQHRWDLYDHWVSEAIRDCENQLHEKRLLYQNIMKRKLEILEAINLEEILHCDVVGMTTTCAARHQVLLQKLGPKIVIVEEAAEALESHVISSLSAKCEHLILIGDHKQLRPAPAVYKLAKDYNLEISLFERLLINKVDYDTLLIQHRMRPDIADLVVPAIYPTLENHPTVLAYGNVVGLQKNLFFIHHTNEEEMAMDETSKKNTHEAQFLVALCRHLVLQGYDPSQITLLTTYTGQMFTLMEEKEKHKLISGVKITVVDNYQGEENDIILLSLVRNNKENKIGFVGSEHRTCVALSRAKKGLYIMGNIDMLSAKSHLWSKIHEVMMEKGSIGSHLTLKCLRHPDQLTDVNKAEDFVAVTEGGCRQMCTEQLSCGHKCRKMCHARSHEGYKCFEACNRVMCPLNHLCQKLCWEECGNCMVKVSVSLPCGHQVDIPCHLEPSEYKCREMVEVTLPDCEHTVLKQCCTPTHHVRCSFDCDTRLPCGHKCEKKCHMTDDPDHLDYKCFKPCTRNNEGCEEEHKCQKLCHEECGLCKFIVNKKLPNCNHFYKRRCSDDPDTLMCMKPCKKKLECGHTCQMKCFEICGNCSVMVDKEIPDCKHTMKMKCSETPLRNKCRNKCQSTRSCGHPCDNVCGKPCDEEKCQALSSTSARASCGHQVRVFCFEINLVPSPEVLMKRCKEPCPSTLECSHRCKGSCSLCLQGRVHIPCKQKCGRPLICGHECIVSCSESCPPCRKKCFIFCEHSKCRNQCGVPCTPCQERCKWACEHLACQRKCGELCDRPPCNEPCKKKLKCGHPCIGFCGEACPPLCRICNAEEVDEILVFLGTEDEEKARFILLPDCGHVLEVTGLDKWLAMGDEGHEVVKLKLCPMCNTPIQSAKRYMNVIKQHLFNVLKVKGKIFGSVKNVKEAVLKAAKELKPKFLVEDRDSSTRKRLVNPMVIFSFQNSPVFKESGDQFNQLYEMIAKKKVRHDAFILNSLEARTEFIKRIVDNYDELKEKVDHHLLAQCTASANDLIRVILRRLDRISPQEHSDLEGECMRFHLVMQLRALESTPSFKTHTKTDWYIKYEACKRIVDGYTPLRKVEYVDLFKRINDVYRVLTTGLIGISKKEMEDVVGAMSLHQGHWKLCPNGHVYVIANCGGAVVEGRCSECNARIGGTDHQLLPSNRTLPDVPTGI